VGGIARKIIDTLIQSVEPGKKECELFPDMVHTQISNGAEPEIFIMFSSGPVEGPGSDKQLLHGAHSPAISSTRILEKGDLVIMEFHTSYAGYLFAAEFSLYFGKAPAELKRIHDVSVQCLERLKEKMKPGVTFKEAAEAEREPCRKAGMDFIELGFHQHGLGSAVPLTMVYKPGQKSLSGDKINDLIIRENMVFSTNIDMHDPNWKKDVGIMLGDTLYVAKSHSRFLVNTPLEYFEKKFKFCL
jgi:Xaa-Pro aminopeptidase